MSGEGVVGALLAVLVALFVYALCVALGLPQLVGIVAALIVLFASAYDLR